MVVNGGEIFLNLQNLDFKLDFVEYDTNFIHIPNFKNIFNNTKKIMYISNFYYDNKALTPKEILFLRSNVNQFTAEVEILKGKYCRVICFENEDIIQITFYN